MNWQPIETAPKDGKALLLYVQAPSGYGLMRIGEWEGDDEGEGVWSISPYCLWRGYEITHWAPLPEPPK